MIDGVDDTVVAHANSIEMLRASQLDWVAREGFQGKGLNPSYQALDDALWQGAQIFFDRRLDLDPIGRHSASAVA